VKTQRMGKKTGRTGPWSVLEKIVRQWIIGTNLLGVGEKDEMKPDREV